MSRLPMLLTGSVGSFDAHVVHGELTCTNDDLDSLRTRHRLAVGVGLMDPVHPPSLF